MRIELQPEMLKEPPGANAKSAVTGVKHTVKASSAITGKQENVGARFLEVEEKQLNTAVSDINDYVQTLQRSLQFSVDKATGRTIITVVDKETDEVIRQIPPETTLRIAKSLQSTVGLIVEERA